MVSNSTHEQVQKAIAALKAMRALFSYVRDMAEHGCKNAVALEIEMCCIDRERAHNHSTDIEEMAQRIAECPERVGLLGVDMHSHFALYGISGTLCNAFAWYVYNRSAQNDLHAQRLIDKLEILLNK